MWAPHVLNMNRPLEQHRLRLMLVLAGAALAPSTKQNLQACSQAAGPRKCRKPSNSMSALYFTYIMDMFFDGLMSIWSIFLEYELSQSVT